MSSKSLESVPLINESKAVLQKAKSKQAHCDTLNLKQENVLLLRPNLYKGIRDRGLRGDLAA